MQTKLLEILVCPKCHGELACGAKEVEADGDITTGTLRCANCNDEYQIISGIPRFVERDNYASSFGLQWNLFKAEQVDNLNGFKISENRFYSVTEWKKEWLDGKMILDAGCGAGRFLDIVSQANAEVVGVDLSISVEGAKTNMAGRKNVHLVQASIYELPFRPETFDGCYCIGVVQHTPDPQKTLKSLAKMVKEAGRIAFFIYERKAQTLFYSKYLIRPLTKRLGNKNLLRLIKISMPILFPITEVVFRIPYLGKYFRFLIPVANYVKGSELSIPELSMRDRYRWALMDTFDMLSPEYDLPQTIDEVRTALTDAGIDEIRRTSGLGLCVEGKKITAQETSKLTTTSG